MDRNKLFNDNQKLVPHVFNTYFKHKLRPHMLNNHEDDFIQEGYLALWDACKNYNPEKGAEFSTYACVCVKCIMTEVMMKLTDNGCYKKQVEVTCSLDDNTNGIWEQHELTPAPEQEDISWVLESEQLSKLERFIIRKVYEGYSMREIGRMVGYSGAYIHQKYHSAINKLKSDMSNEE